MIYPTLFYSYSCLFIVGGNIQSSRVPFTDSCCFVLPSDYSVSLLSSFSFFLLRRRQRSPSSNNKPPFLIDETLVNLRLTIRGFLLRSLQSTTPRPDSSGIKPLNPPLSFAQVPLLSFNLDHLPLHFDCVVPLLLFLSNTMLSPITLFWRKEVRASWIQRRAWRVN